MSKIVVTIDGHTFEVEAKRDPHADSEWLVMIDGEAARVIAPDVAEPGHAEWTIVDDRPYEIVLDEDWRWIKAHLGLHRLEVRDLATTVPRPLSGDGRVKAPIPGLITRVLVNAGDRVEVGQPLVVLVAMKMENEIRAPRAGTVGTVNVKVGQDVALNDLLIEIG